MGSFAWPFVVSAAVEDDQRLKKEHYPLSSRYYWYEGVLGRKEGRKRRVGAGKVLELGRGMS